MKKLAVALVLVLTTTLSCTTKYRNMHSFETVWQTVNQAHYDPTFGGMDWKAAHERYKPQIAAAESKKEFLVLSNQMLFELNLSHLLVFYPDDLKRFMPVLFAKGSIGVDVKLLDGQAVITRVRSGSAGAHAGLQPGFIIERIDGKTTEQIIEEAEALLIPPYNSRNRLNNLSNYISGHIYGPPNTTVLIIYLDKQGKRKETVINRKSRGRARSSSMAMPPFYVEFESKRLENNIGYVWFNHWAEPADVSFINALALMRDAQGLIIDLRGNPGGFMTVIDTITKHLLKEKTLFSTLRLRDKTIDKVLNPAHDVYTGPIVVLIDERSTSSSEYFAGCMQEIDRVEVVGEPSPGYLLFANWKKLLNGAYLMHTIAQPLTSDGKIIEGNGVVPDIEVKLDRTLLLHGRDSQLEKAIEYINSKKAK
jgi:carboxyl-terminal processing protease